ncbi:hypothetical protein BYT27DRAFT_7318749 [Phlegmacium glaucopus]|nr:hypothetical protein BYT27DRAFT_7318749 [Phlegmacium glaucopus]
MTDMEDATVKINESKPQREINRPKTDKVSAAERNPAISQNCGNAVTRISTRLPKPNGNFWTAVLDEKLKDARFDAMHGKTTVQNLLVFRIAKPNVYSVCVCGLNQHHWFLSLTLSMTTVLVDTTVNPLNFGYPGKDIMKSSLPFYFSESSRGFVKRKRVPIEDLGPESLYHLLRLDLKNGIPIPYRVYFNPTVRPPFAQYPPCTWNIGSSFGLENSRIWRVTGKRAANFEGHPPPQSLCAKPEDNRLYEIKIFHEPETSHSISIPNLIDIRLEIWSTEGERKRGKTHAPTSRQKLTICNCTACTRKSTIYPGSYRQYCFTGSNYY